MWSAHIMKCTHSIGHRSAVLGQPSPLGVVAFPYTSKWLVQNICSMNSLNAFVHSWVHWKEWNGNSNLVMVGQTNMYCIRNMLTGFGAVTKTGFASTPDAPAGQQYVVTPALHNIQRKQFQYMYGTTAIQIYTTLTLYEVCLYFGRVGRIVHESFIHHTLLDACEGGPTEFSSQLASFQWPSYFYLFSKT